MLCTFKLRDKLTWLNYSKSLSVRSDVRSIGSLVALKGKSLSLRDGVVIVVSSSLLRSHVVEELSHRDSIGTHL